jgi:hypothetical protein
MRVLVALSLLLFALVLPSSALAAPPTHETISLNDPALDAEESAWASDWCGFPVVGNVSGHIRIHIKSKTGPGVVELAIYGIRIQYTNPANGATFKVRDIGPDRFFVKDGRLYVAVTGRSEGGTGTIGQVVIDLETGEVVRQAGREIGLYWDRLCQAID